MDEAGFIDEAERALKLDKAGLIGGCLRLPVVVDANRLLREVEALSDEAWATTGGRTGVHSAAAALFLRGHAPAAGRQPIQDLPVLDDLPYCRTLITEVIGAPPLRCLLARLPGGGRIAAHTDRGPYFAGTIRVHFPVITHPEVWMLCDGLVYAMATGEAWALNNSASHGVWNADPARPRTHLICDFKSAPGLLDLLVSGERGLGRRSDAVVREIGVREVGVREVSVHEPGKPDGL